MGEVRSQSLWNTSRPWRRPQMAERSTSHSGGELEGSTVILDPVLQSQLAAVQGGPGEPRVLIEADPENPGGGLRFVVIQEEDGTAAVLEESAETVEVG